MLKIAYRCLHLDFNYGIELWFYCFQLEAKKFSYFSNYWVISVLIFWLFYLARLFFDVNFLVPNWLFAWELVAWSLGSSLPIAICAYLYSAQNNIIFILSQ